MNFKIVKALYKKEILDVLRDKKTVIMMLLVPLVLYPLLIVAGLNIVTKIATDITGGSYKIALDFENEALENIINDSSDEDYRIELVDVENCKEALENGDIDAYMEKDNSSDGEKYVINYLSAETGSDYARGISIDILEKYARSITVRLLEEAGFDSEYILQPVKISIRDYSTKEESAGSIMGKIIPFMLVTSLLMGTMYPAIDTTAGERERGTLETVLTLPVTNRELFVSKFLTVATIGIVSALLNIVSMGGVGIYMYRTVLTINGGQGIRLYTFLPVIVICALCIIAFAVFISALSMSVCVFAKSYKEANNYITPLTIIVMFAAMGSVMPELALTRKSAAVPVVNICLLIRDLLQFKYNPTLIMIVLMSNIIIGILAILLLGKLYNSEAILFGEEGTSLRLFEKPGNMIKGGVPGIGDLILALALLLIAVIYIGGALSVKSGLLAIFVTQLMIFLIPVIYALYTKRDMEKTFRLRLPGIWDILGAILMIIGAMIIGTILTSVTSAVFKNSAVEMNRSTLGLFDGNFLQVFLLVAVAPAVCEEIMFRGFVFSALESKTGYRKAIIIAGLIFGIYHMNPVQAVTTTFIGIIICIAAYKSGSILPGMIMHFVNNALSCVLAFYPEKVCKMVPWLVNIRLTIAGAVILVLAGALLICSGCKLMDIKIRKYAKKQ